MQQNAVDASFFLSGLGMDGKTHVVKVVDAGKLDESKASFSRLDSLHVYSLSPKGAMTPENLVEVDLEQSREALGTTLNASYASLGRVSLIHAPKRRAAGATRRTPTSTMGTMGMTGTSASPPKSQKKQETKEVKTEDETMVEAKDAKPATEESKREAVPGAGSNKNNNKKRKQIVDSDSDDDGAEPAQVKTYFNDKGEEVTEIIQNEGTKPTAKAEPTGRSTEPMAGVKPKQETRNPSAAKKSICSKKAPGQKQKGIMGFFKPKQ